MDGEIQTGAARGWRKAIPPGRDRLQSRMLVWPLVALLLAVMALELWSQPWGEMHVRWLPAPTAFSIVFALVVWRMRAATLPAAALGGVVCMNLLLVQPTNWLDTALPALMVLFVLTFAATRFGRRRKETMGAGEPRQGRRASQIVANLGIAGLCAAGISGAWLAACIAALAEATADTVSSEMGQALGGTTRMITTGRKVPAGTDGGVSLMGTALGAAAAATVVSVAVLCGTISLHAALPAFSASIVGLIFDSVLGATVERWGWIGNDWVNFASTVLAAALTYVLAQHRLPG